jgi:hypothetical protein
MNPAKVFAPIAGAVLGAAFAEWFRKPGTSGATLGMLGASLGLVAGVGVALVLPTTVELVQGHRYRITSPLPVQGDSAAVLAGLGAMGAVPVGGDPSSLVYELTPSATNTITIGSGGFDFTEPLTNRPVHLPVTTVQEISA